MAPTAEATLPRPKSPGKTAKKRYTNSRAAIKQTGQDYGVDRAEQDFCRWRRDAEKCC